MASLVLNRGIFYAVFTENYKQKWIKIGRMQKTAAREVLRKLEEDFNKKKFGIIEEKPIPFIKYSVEYLAYSKANKAETSYERDVTSMQTLKRFFGSLTLPRITSHHIEKFKIKRYEEKVSRRTVNIELSCLSHMMKKAVEWRYIKESPLKGVKFLPHKNKPPRFLTLEEIEKLLKSSTPWLKAIAIVMLNSGLRESERRNLRLQDLDFIHKRILVMPSKGKEYRVVPMNEDAQKVLKYLSENYIPPYSLPTISYPRKEHQKVYVFCKEDGSPVHSIKKALRNACEKAGLIGVTPHTFRHTFASHLVMSGVDLRTVQKYMGHKSIKTTMIYSHLTPEHVTKSVEKLPWIGKYVL